MRRIWFLFIVLSFSCALGLTGDSVASSIDPGNPIRKLRVSFDRSQFLNFIHQLHVLADEYSFAIRAGYSSPDPEDVLVQMQREDVRIIGYNSSPAGESVVVFKIGIYNNTDKKLPDLLLDNIIGDMKRAVGGIASLVFREVE